MKEIEDATACALLLNAANKPQSTPPRIWWRPNFALARRAFELRSTLREAFALARVVPSAMERVTRLTSTLKRTSPKVAFRLFMTRAGAIRRLCFILLCVKLLGPRSFMVRSASLSSNGNHWSSDLGFGSNDPFGHRLTVLVSSSTFIYLDVVSFTPRTRRGT
jgi:hypothetical protein